MKIPDHPSPGTASAWSHAGLGQPEAAVTAFARLMELLPATNDEDLWWRPDPARIGEILAPYDEIFARVVQMRPRHRSLLIARFHYFGRRRRWREAADIVRGSSSSYPVALLAGAYRRILPYHCGDFDGYQRESRQELISTGGSITVRRNP